MSVFASQRLPLVVAPMFLVSSPELVIAAARAGVVGGFPGPNARTIDVLEEWMARIHAALAPARLPWLFNMFVHSSYDRFAQELELVKQYQPAMVSTALGSPKRVIETVHGYGGQVYADVVTPEMAKKSIAAGVDALILVTHGAGGHTGRYHPLPFIAEVREFWDGPLGVAGCISRGADAAAMLVAGADFVVAGTRFIAATEGLASEGYRAMLSASHMTDIVESMSVSGVAANWMRASLEQAGISSHNTDEATQIDFSGDADTPDKAWKDVWSAGQGVGTIKRAEPCADIVEALYAEFTAALRAIHQRL